MNSPIVRGIVIVAVAVFETPSELLARYVKLSDPL